MNNIRVLIAALSVFFLGSVSAAPVGQYPTHDYFGFDDIRAFVMRNAKSVVDLANSLLHHKEPEASAPDRREVECLAQALYFESRGEPLLGQMAVAHVIFNRVQHHQFPGSVCGVVSQRNSKGCQFSWVCQDRPKIKRGVYESLEALALDFYLRYEELEDITLGALYFHADYVSPTWQNMRRTKKIGKHIFYRPQPPFRKNK
jgi:N-acetylmuramoyl-L-alanine amidase